ncbi:MAG: gliding motility protein GldL [Bacteroidales bacterium]
MLSIAELTQSTGWKKFMGKLYGLGAAVVLLGALFKIQHWPGGGMMLTIGMGTEIVIFFFSAFEPLHEEVDWSLVYPELAGIEEDSDYVPTPRQRGGGGGGTGNGLDTAALEQLFENADISPELFEKLGEGLKKLTQTTENLGHISNATEATNAYVDNLQAASESVSSLAEGYSKSGEQLHSSVEQLTASYQNTAGKVAQSGEQLAEQLHQSNAGIGEAYKGFEEALKVQLTTLNDGTSGYQEKIEGLNKNLSALNAAYEMQLNATHDHVKSSEEIFSGVGSMMENLQSSVEQTELYKQSMSQLNQNISALNAIYGNMLSAMNVSNQQNS